VANVPEVAGAAPYSQTNAQVVAGGVNWYTVIGGTTPAWLSVGNWSMAHGNFFTQDDVSRVSKVAVLGSTVAANLFPLRWGRGQHDHR
jgi:putative ABC transport system permease protein